MKTLRRIWNRIKGLFRKEKPVNCGREAMDSLMNDWYGSLLEDHVRVSEKYRKARAASKDGKVTLKITIPSSED